MYEQIPEVMTLNECRTILKIGKNTGWSCNGKKVPFSAVLTAGSAKKCRFYHVSGLLLI